MKTRLLHSRETNASGFTLIEIVITIVLLSIISGLAAMIILAAARSYSREQDRSDAHYQTRLAMERMAREIRTIRQPTELGTTALGTIDPNPTNGLIFTDVTGTTITYSLTGTNLNRTINAAKSPLADGVTLLEFRHYDNANVLTTVPASVWTIEIFMQDQQGADTLQMRTRVHPRNF